ITFMGHDCKVVTESYAARALWSLGFSDRALERVNRAVTLSETLAHAQSMAIAFHLAAEILNLRGEYAAAASRSQSLIALADEYSLELWLACANVDLGWAQIEQGQLDEGIENVRRGLAAQERTGAKLWRAHFLSVLAGGLGKKDLADAALATAQQAVEQLQQTGEGYPVAEIFRGKGELLRILFADWGSQEGTGKWEQQSPRNSEKKKVTTVEA